MIVKFKNDVTKECTNPIEQKLFKNGVPVGWICSFSFNENTSSIELDEILNPENITELLFLNSENKVLFSLNGYSNITSVVVRHAETDGSVEIQMTKGV